MTKYARRRAVVVGEAGGIGLAIAKRLVEGGASVLLAARTAEARALAVTELGSAARVVAPSAVAEVLAGGAATRPDSDTRTGADTRTGTGTAPRTGTGGHDRPGPRVDLLFADAIPTARPLLPYIEDGGAIVLTSPTPCPDAVRALAAELAARGIRVNAVAPGCIEAPGSGAVPLPPLGRLGAAEEVARAALFLATEATFTTGARLPVDGGLARP
ncbi:SDR family oxidoreductase [Streptomyces sp. OUCMDZ-4982]|uniref:SDR family oxidoreductase n=1 Tax=Streptomyces sp. OUCMDZ-4982 TaxID=2973090 RepID=UPI00215CB099|nr:SDR family oxidoreductase [Streptomyces sp. OUCMDZ-4982]MCR8942603.1 SDR family oxidoreductase [Streptomyces sp. OUCMDZ-4982]